MCSVGDDLFDDDGLMSTIEVSRSKTCNKCKTAETHLVLRSKDAYCKSCFLENVTHKFKSTLGKSRLIRPGNRVLILYEDNQASTALLHMVRDGLNLNTPKKLNFCPVIVLIEDLYHLTIEERHNVIEQANKVIRAFHFDLFLVSLAQYASNTGSIDKLICQASEVLPISENDEHELFRNVQPKTSVTNKKELISILKRNLLIEVAKHLDCKFIFTNEISKDIAINLLTNVSLACGNRIPIEAGFCDDIDSQVKILRPLYLFDSKEIEFYTKYNNINYTHSRNEETNPYSSIQTLLEKFVVDLQANFPATINTVLKIGDKLDIVKGDTSCQLCKIPICEQYSQLTSEESTRFSSLVSTSKIDLADPDLSNKFAPINGKAYCFSCDELSKCLLKR